MPCKLLRAQQWVSRMTFETAYNPYWPIFVTPTYATEPDDYERIKIHFAQFIKALRDRGFTVRYFATVERGSQKGRLHLHCILWSDISFLKYREQRSYLEKCWRHGFCLLRIMYGGKRGFNYAAKYILKDTIWYTYSRRPGIGAKGKLAYLERGIKEFLTNGRIIYRIRLRVLGEEIITTVHSGWRKALRDILSLRVDWKSDVIYQDLPVKLESYEEQKERLINGKA